MAGITFFYFSHSREKGTGKRGTGTCILCARMDEWLTPVYCMGYTGTGMGKRNGKDGKMGY